MNFIIPHPVKFFTPNAEIFFVTKNSFCMATLRWRPSSKNAIRSISGEIWFPGVQFNFYVGIIIKAPTERATVCVGRAFVLALSTFIFMCNFLFASG